MSGWFLVAVIVGALSAPLIVGGTAGWLLGYGFAKGAGAGLVFSMVTGAVGGLIGAGRTVPGAAKTLGAFAPKLLR